MHVIGNKLIAETKVHFMHSNVLMFHIRIVCNIRASINQTISELINESINK